jgi:two-component sensor histidine kinase
MAAQIGWGANQSETVLTPSGPTASERGGPAAGPTARSRQDEHRELDHRLANSLQLAADFLIFEHTRVTDPRARAALIETAERLSAVGQMHRFLAGHHQARGVDLDPFLAEFGRLIGDSTGLDCSVESDAVTVPAEMAQQLAIAINELAMNAAKHAYPWGHRGALHITCRRRGDTLTVVVADEGRGLTQDFVAGLGQGPGQGLGLNQGLGMSILQAILRQLRGTFHAASDGGARFTLTLPLLPHGAAPIPRSFVQED